MQRRHKCPLDGLYHARWKEHSLSLITCTFGHSLLPEIANHLQFPPNPNFFKAIWSSYIQKSCNCMQAVARFSKVPKTFRVRKAILINSDLLILYSWSFHVIKGIKIKITESFVLRDAFVLKLQRELSPEIRPKTFGTFDKRAPDFHKCPAQSKRKTNCLKLYG